MNIDKRTEKKQKISELHKKMIQAGYKAHTLYSCVRILTPVSTTDLWKDLIV